MLELREAPGTPSPLRVELWDWDMVGKDDFLGMVSAPPALSVALHCLQGGRKGSRVGCPRVRKGGCKGCLIRSG